MPTSKPNIELLLQCPLLSHISHFEVYVHIPIYSEIYVFFVVRQSLKMSANCSHTSCEYFAPPRASQVPCEPTNINFTGFMGFEIFPIVFISFPIGSFKGSLLVPYCSCMFLFACIIRYWYAPVQNARCFTSPWRRGGPGSSGPGSPSVHGMVTAYTYTDKKQMQKQTKTHPDTKNTSPHTQMQVQTPKYKSRHPKYKSRYLKYNI